MVERMRPGSVLVDIAVDQGGCFEGTHATTHTDPTYRVHDAIYYAVANMPGAVPLTSTLALTNATLRYTLALADLGTDAALAADASLRGLVDPRRRGDRHPHPGLTNAADTNELRIRSRDRMRSSSHSAELVIPVRGGPRPP
jgi:hypothetical protein